jgi:hypothetical protein
MSSKFIPKSRIKEPVYENLHKENSKPNTQYCWSNRLTGEQSEQEKLDSKKVNEYRTDLARTRDRIHAIHIEELTFRDLYEFPFTSKYITSQVYDKNENFIFQFSIDNLDSRNRMLICLNDEYKPDKQHESKYSDGIVSILKDGIWHDVIMIRGWGNLTGSGAYNLDYEYARKIQDTLGIWIAEKLSNNY